MNKPDFPIHVVQGRKAERIARSLSRRLETAVYAICRPDESGRWHVGTEETLLDYPDFQRYYCIENY